MALKIRLRKQGRTNRPFYRMVVTDSRNPRDGRYLESLGWYNPIETETEKVLSVKPDRIQYWLEKGAQLTEKTEALVSRAAPDVMQVMKQKEIARRAASLAKKKARKKAAA